MASPHQPARSSVDFLRTRTAFRDLPSDVFERAASRLEWMAFDEDEVVFAEHDLGDRLFLVVHGRLAVTRSGPGGEELLLAWVRSGESVGELALLGSQVRTATVRASRATVAVALSLEAYQNLAQDVPQSLTVVNRLLALRLQQVITGSAQQSESGEILSIVAASRDAPVAALSAGIVKALEKAGPVLYLNPARVKELTGENTEAVSVDAESQARLLSWLHDQETRHRFIVLEADIEDTPWTRRCLRHADKIVLVARATARPGAHVIEGSLLGVRRRGYDRPRELVLVHDDSVRTPSGTGAWLDALPVTDHHHVRLGVAEDIERLGRFLRGRAVALALSGGAALGFAHIGVFRALAEAGISIDLVCGTSMGSIIGGQIALGRTWQEISREMRKHFRGRSIYDHTLPVISLFKARRLDERLQMIVGETMIEDLWLKYFCVSSNLTTARERIHRRGRLKFGMKASSAVPGLFPPLVDDNGDLLADGALVNNLPADIAGARSGGEVIAVNVISTVDHVTTGGYVAGASVRQVLLSRWRGPVRSPTIVHFMLRGAFLATIGAAERIRKQASLYIEPRLEAFGFLNTDRFDDIVEAGYQAAKGKLDSWRPMV